jgi:hypothetical protein
MTNGQFPDLVLLYEADVLVSVLELSMLTHFQVFPNPNASDYLIRFGLLEGSAVTLSICDLFGNTYYDVSDFYSSGVHSVHLSTLDFPAGTYVCRMLVGGRQVGLVSFVVAR